MIRWKALLSDDSIVVEHEGEYTERLGERLPWPRLIEFLNKNALYIKQLDLEIDNKIIHLPFECKFSKKPSFYSFQHILEVDNILSGHQITEFIDIAAHFKDFVVHYITNINDAESWVTISDPFDAISPSPNVQ